MRKVKNNHGGTETRRKSCLIYKPLNKSLFEEGQKQKLVTKDTEEKQKSQRKIWGKQVTKIRCKPQRILGIVVRSGVLQRHFIKFGCWPRVSVNAPTFSFPTMTVRLIASPATRPE